MAKKYIDVDTLEKILEDEIAMMQEALGTEDDPEIKIEQKAYTDILDVVKGLPTQDVRENVHGKWEPMAGGMGVCSVCGKAIGNRHTANFCPNCGADMRGEV